MNESYERKVSEIKQSADKELHDAKSIRYYNRNDLEELETRQNYKLASWVVVSFLLGFVACEILRNIF